MLSIFNILVIKLYKCFIYIEYTQNKEEVLNRGEISRKQNIFEKNVSYKSCRTLSDALRSNVILNGIIKVM